MDCISEVDAIVEVEVGTAGLETVVSAMPDERGAVDVYVRHGGLGER